MSQNGFRLESGSFERSWSMRADYLATLQAPLDGMWEDAFLRDGAHWLIYRNDRLLGYCVLNEANALLGFQCVESAAADAAFDACLSHFGASLAFASTAEPRYLNLCLDRQRAVKVNALMYGDGQCELARPQFPGGADVKALEMADLHAAIDFAESAIGANRDWLTSYYTERITRQELYGVYMEQQLIAAGELRISSSQAGVADAGMVVAAAHRRRGIATAVLQWLLIEGRRRGLRVVCSTEQDNTGARQAIVKAGFVAQHRVLEFSFPT